MLKCSLASQFSIGESSYFPERLRMKFEFISCELIFLNSCGCKSEFQVQFRNIAPSLRLTEISRLLFVCLINFGSSLYCAAISRANPLFSGNISAEEVIKCEPSLNFAGGGAISREINQSSSSFPGDYLEFVLQAKGQLYWPQVRGRG